MGNRESGVGSGEKGKGIGDQGSGIGDQGSGIGDQGSGIGDQGSGSVVCNLSVSVSRNAFGQKPQSPVPSPQSLSPGPWSLVPLLSVICYLLSVTSCSNASGKLLIIEANFLNSQGRFTEAITRYTKALEYEDAAPYAEYGLGYVYLSMGEEKAALDYFKKAGNTLDSLPPNQNMELRYRVCYNTGVAQFSGGNFPGAADSFRDALKIDGRKIEAKRNLELSILSVARQSAVSGERRENEGLSAMFDYIRQKELAQWANREWQPEEDNSEPDY